MIVGFTGTQSGMTEFQREELKMHLMRLSPHEITHGDCIGSDFEAHNIARDLNIRWVTIFPPMKETKQAYCGNLTKDKHPVWEWIKLGDQWIRWAPRFEYLERNKLIAAHCDFLIACPKEYRHTMRSGTWATIRAGWHKQKLIQRLGIENTQFNQSAKNFNVLIIPPVQR
jgi:hypothetical protein